MAYKDFDGFSPDSGADNSSLTLKADGQSVDLPDASFVRDADITRDGMDLVLEGPNGSIVVEGYFSAAEAPDLVAPDGSALTPELVNSFAKSPAQFAQNASMTDESPVGGVQEISGEATVTRTDGTSEPITIGTPIFQGDIIETSADGAVNIVFIDETSFAVSEDARLAIDEYVFDPATQAGSTNFSVLKGVFVFTSGLIGRDDPDDVEIDTPIGSIGIRGTIIAGDVDEGEITVVEGAIVLRDFSGNELTLANQFETGRFDPVTGEIIHMGELAADDVSQKFSSVSKVSPSLFSSIEDAAAEQQGQVDPQNAQDINDDPTAQDGSVDQNNDGEVDGSVDQDGDGSVDGSVDQNEAEAQEEAETQEEETQEEAEAEAQEENNPEGEQAPEGENVDGADNTSGDPLVPPPLNSTLNGGFAGDGSGLISPTAPGSTSDPNITSSTQNTTNTAAASSSEESSHHHDENPPPDDPPDNPPPPPGNDPFSIEVVNINAVSETDATGAVLGTITSVNGTINAASIQLNGLFADILEVVPGGNANEFDIKLMSGESIDWDFLAEHGLNATVNVQADSTSGDSAGKNVTANILAVDENPIHAPHAPAEFFNGGEGGHLIYHFDKEFFSGDFADPITFELNPATITALNAWTNDAGGVNPDILSNTQGDGIVGTGGDENMGWTFDESTGMLELFFNGNFTITPGMFDSLNIQIRAVDGANNDSGWQTYNLDAYKPTDPFGDLISTSNKVRVDTGGTDSLTINNSNNSTVFMEGGDDSVMFIGNSNNIHISLGDGNNTAVIGASGTIFDNTIVGGFDKDSFLISNAQNKFFGMDGDDDFTLDLTSGVGTWLESNPGNANVRFVGGHSDFRAGLVLDPLLDPFGPGGSPGGRGDSLVLQGAGNIDFRAVDNNYIRGMERIDADNGQSNTITLDYDDVIEMTDYKETLIINLDGGDVLDLLDARFDLANFEKVGDDVMIDDSRQGESNPDKAYDIYFDGKVTLLIHDSSSGGAVVNFDGTAVTV